VQYYMLIKLEDKLDTLFSFLRSHTLSKSLVFFSSIKQVRFAYEAFRKLNLSRSLPLFELHGKKKQTQRMAIFFGYKEKKYASLFTTNIAARGLDFPSIDWVIQVDCPEDVPTYIHRVGRTARYVSEGKSLLLLMPSEEKFIGKIKSKGLELKRIFPNPNKSMTIKSSLQSIVTENVELKHLAQKAFISYIRSVHLNTDKEIFDISKLDTTEFAASMGLIQTPVIRFAKPGEVIDDDENKQDEEQEEAVEKTLKPQGKSKLAKLKEKIKEKKKQKLQMKQIEDGLPTNNMEEGEKVENNKPTIALRPRKVEEDDDTFLTVKRKSEQLDPSTIKTALVASKNQMKKINLEGGIFNGRNKILFDNDGNTYTVDEMRAKKIKESNDKVMSQPEPIYDYIEKVERNREADKLRDLERIRENRLKKKLKLKQKNQDNQDHGDVGGPSIGFSGSGDEDDQEGDDEEIENEDNDNSVDEEDQE